MKTRTFCSAFFALAMAAGMAQAKDYDRVNGSVDIADNEVAGSAETVNGSITIGRNARASSVETVNGRIELREGAEVGSAETVNGGITLRSNARVVGDAGVVNGSISLEEGAEVRGDVESVNGDLTLKAARVLGDLETVSGDIEVGANSRVDGGITVRKPNSVGSWWGTSRPPRIVIGPNAAVAGVLKFEREVELFVSDSAKIGAVTGATAKRFSGSEP